MVNTKFFKNNGPFTLAQAAQICEAELKDQLKAEIEIFDMADLASATDGQICSFYDKKMKAQAEQIKATACIVSEELVQLLPQNVVALVAKDPKLATLKLKYALYAEILTEPKIAESAHIATTAKVGQNCFIGENVVIEDDAVVGDNVRISHNSVIGRGCEIGNNCRIESNVSVYCCKMGNNCFIDSGTAIGKEGFGFMCIMGQHKKIPQVGSVIIGNDVDVGANVCIDRGALADTVIADGCRIDNLVQIAHNDKFGRGCILVGQVGVAGSTTFGDYVVCGGQAGFGDHITVGSGAQIAGQSGTFRNVEPGAALMGSPAMPIKDFMRLQVMMQRMLKK